MPTNARNIADGLGGGGGFSLPTALHALTVDEDGMLIYTKALYSGSEIETIDADFNIAATDEDYFTMFVNYSNDYDSLGRPKGTTRYEQWYHGSRDVFYYIDDDGYLVMRTNQRYTYTGPK
jgi:hypothetical protein